MKYQRLTQVAYSPRYRQTSSSRRSAALVRSHRSLKTAPALDFPGNAHFNFAQAGKTHRKAATTAMLKN